MSDLRAELASLRAENARLRKLLKLTDAEAAPARGTQASVVRQGAWSRGRAIVPPGKGRVLCRVVRRAA